MCILFIALHQHPKYPLIIAANRDEFRQRPTAAMHWWQSPTADVEPSVLAGKDLSAGGTWLAIARSGKFAALTNFRKLPIDNSRQYTSRGELVLKAHQLGKTELTQLLSEQYQQYQGFNLLYGDQHGLTCFDSVNHQFTDNKVGFFSLCNGALDDIWPKMARGEQALERFIESQNTGELNHQDLLALLQDNQTAPDNLLPKTGLPYEWEKQLSAIFIRGEEYGTRSSCVYTLRVDGMAQVSEVTYNTSGDVDSQVEFSWQTENN